MPATTSTGLLLLWVLIAVVGLVVLVARFKLNAFLALILASVFVGLCSGMNPGNVANAFQEGVGSTLGFIAVVVGLGTMLGKMLAESGGAEIVADRFIQMFGEKRLPWAMMLVGFIVGLPVFFTVGLVLLVPVLFTLTKSTGSSLLRLGIPLIAGLSVSHGLVPPHPGPLVAIEKLGADTGRTILYSLAIGLPTAMLAGPVFGGLMARHVPLAPGGIGERLIGETARGRRPGFAITLFTILLPVVLMLATTVGDLTLPKGHTVNVWARLIGSPLMALLIAVLFSLYSFGRACGFNRHQILKFTEDCVGPAASIILVVGAGGGFSKVLDYSGADEAIAGLVKNMPVSPLILGWLVAALIRVAVGSATVAITMASAIMAPIAASQPGINLELLVIVMGAGSLILSHLNDGGFWFVKEYFNMTVPQTLKTWTVLETIIAVTALVFALLLDRVL